MNPATSVEEIRLLSDRAALQDLIYKYCRGIDRRDFELVRECYHEDATDDHGEQFCGTRDGFIAWLPGALAQFEATQHRISNVLLAIDGDYAEGESYAVAYHRTPPPDAKELIGTGRYVDNFERRNGVWKFSHRMCINDSMSINTVDPGVFKDWVAAIAVAQSNENDPSYRHLRLLTRKSIRN